MKDSVWQVAAVLVLSVVCAAASAQTCRNDIMSTAPDTRFADQGDGTVIDFATGLMWKQCVESLGGPGCAIVIPPSSGVKGFPWQEALQLAVNAGFAGYTDWRLPNKNELESLVERQCRDPAINARFFPNTPTTWVYWTASQFALEPHFVWHVSFFSGDVKASDKFSFNLVRLVRGGQ